MKNQLSDKDYKIAARLFGISFIITFLAYGTGSTLIDGLISTPDILHQVALAPQTIILGGILMAIIHTLTNIALPVAMMPILKPHSKFLANGYFGMAIAGTVTLIIGAVFLMLLVPLSEYGQKIDQNTSALLALLLKKAGFYAYQTGMALWGCGGLMLVTILLRAKLVPKFIGIWGIIGYQIFTAGTIFELFGYEYGLMANIPGGLFEISLSFWLIFKGFNVPNERG